MRRFRIYLIIMIILIFITALHGIDFQVEVITGMNDASAIKIVNNKVLAATSGGLLIYDLSNEDIQKYTTGEGFYSQQFTTIEKTPQNIVALGSVDGILCFLDLQNHTISNETSIRNNPITDFVAVDDTLWVLTENFVSVYRYIPDNRKYQFIDFFKNFGNAFSKLQTIFYLHKQIWIGSTDGLFYAPSDYSKFNLKSSSNWSYLSSADGLAGNSVLDITGDGSSLYLATNGGINKIDFPQITTLATGFMNKVKVVEGQIYVSNSNEIFKFIDGGLNSIKNFPFVIKDFDFNSQNDIWVALEKRGIINLETGKRIFIDGPLDNYIGNVFKDSRGWLWCSSGLVRDDRRQGLFLYKNGEWSNFKFIGAQNWLALNSTISFIEDTDGNIWVGSYGGGMAIFTDDLTIHPITRNTQPGQVWISSVSQDDTIDVQTPPELQNILSNVTGNSLRCVVTDFLLDSERNSIWLLNFEAISDKAIVQFKDTKFSNQISNLQYWSYYSKPSGTPYGGEFSNSFYTITKDIFGIFWLASDGRGALRMQANEDGVPTGWDILTESDNLKSVSVRDIQSDQDGYVWIGTAAGLSAYLGGTVFDFREEFQPIGLNIYNIFIDSQNNKWFATDKGLSVLRNSGSPFDAQSWFHIVPRKSDITRTNTFRADLPSEDIHSVFLDENTGDIYLGTDAGIAVIHNNPFTSSFSTFNNVQVGPNPFIISQNSTSILSFYNLITSSEVKILTANGRLVRRLNPDNFSEVQGSQAQWDGRNMEGELVASGVYVYLITTEEGEVSKGKFLVISK